MWESLLDFPRGRLSTRNFVMFFAAIIVASFGYLLASSSPVNALDGSWDGNNITYDGGTYEPAEVATAPGLIGNLPVGATVFQSISGSTPQTAKLIYFKSGDVPKSAGEATYIVYTLNPPNSYSDGRDQKTITLTPSEEEVKDRDGADATEASSCMVDNIGWLVCGIGGYMASGIDTVYRVVADFLTVQPLTLNQGSLYNLWDVMRNFANVLFVIGFLFVIYSYLAGGGFNGYEIRKILPRVVIAAILVNLSYFICAVAVDASNIIGVSLQELLINIRESSVAIEENRNVTWDEITAYILSGGTIGTIGFLAATGGSIASLAFLLIGVLITVVFALFVAFIILAARQAIIIMLIVLSPIAFAAFILPNTEKWFDRWRSVFTTMLLLFPIFSLLFGGAQLAGAAIIQNAPNLAIMLFGMAVQVVPLVITPLLIQFSGSLLGRIAGLVNNGQKGLVDRSKGWTNKQAEYHKDRALGRPTNPYNLMRRGGQLMYRRGKNQEDRQKAWQQDAENLRQSHRSYQRVDDHKRDSEARHKQIEAHHEEHYQRRVYANPVLRDQLRDTRLSEGRSKIFSGAMEAQDERTLQTALNTDASYANLRYMKIQASVDSGVAQINSTEVESDGKRVLAETVDSSNALKTMKSRTYENEKRAEVLETIVNKNSEANWNTTSRTDPGVQNLRVREVVATDQATKAEEQWKSLIENIVAKGGAAPQVAIGNMALADSIRDLRQDIQIESEVQDSAKMVQQENMIKRLKQDSALRDYAGGVAGQQGANRVYAKTKTNYLNAMMERIKESRSVIDEYNNAELQRLYFHGVDRYGNQNVDEEMRQAAMQEILLKKGNHWMIQKSRDWVSQETGMIYKEKRDQNGNVVKNANGDDVFAYYEPARNNDGTLKRDANGKTETVREITDPDEVESRRDRQQLFMDAYKQTGHYVASMSGTDRGEYEIGTGILNMEDAIVRDITDDKWDGQRVVKTDNDEWQRIIQIVRDPAKRKNISLEARKKLVQHIKETQSNRTMNGSIKGRERGLMNTVIAYLDENDTRLPRDKETKYWINNDRQVVLPGTPGAEEVTITTVAPTVYDPDRFIDSADGYGPPGPNGEGLLKRDGTPR